jgi:hypothetical protein
MGMMVCCGMAVNGMGMLMSEENESTDCEDGYSGTD